jgi:hypothetical protein
VLVVMVATVAAISSPLLHVFGQPSATVTAASARDAAVAILAGAFGAGILWGAVTALAARAARVAGPMTRRVPAFALVALVALALVVGAAAINDPAHAVTRQWDAFTNLQVNSAQKTRFLSGGGNRYDYWRVALDELRSEPLRGVGAGSYQFTYFKERRTAEDIRQPHSLELQALAELGIVGGALVALFIGGVLVGFARRASRARRSPAEAALVVAAGGTFLVWLVHTTVDWIHLLPGVTGVALAAAAVLLSPWRSSALVRGRLHTAAIAACAALVICAAVFLGRATLADNHASSARDAVASQPRRALAETGRSLALNPDAVSTHYLQSAAYARLHDYNGASGALLAAIRVEPRNFVTWALLGDLAVRHGDVRQARVYYRRALRLNPRDPQLIALARNPPRPPSR